MGHGLLTGMVYSIAENYLLYYTSKHTCVLSNTHQLKNILNGGINIVSVILKGLHNGNQVLENEMETAHFERGKS